MNKKDRNIKLIILAPIIFIVIVFLVIAFKGHINFYDVNFDKLGNFGGFVGGLVGTFLTIVATVYIYLTYHKQKKELKSQKKELALQRQLIAQQQFESTFFNMLNVHRELKKEFVLNISKRITNYSPIREENKPELIGTLIHPTTLIGINDFFGIDALNFIRTDFEIIFKEFKRLNNTQDSRTFGLNIIKHEIQINLLENKQVLETDEKQIIKLIFWTIFNNYRNILSHYFRNVYHILKFIRENEIQNNLNYQKYADIFQSQLNEDEQFLLFYNFIVFEDESKKHLSTIDLCNNYKFLENLGCENLLDKDLHNNNKFYSFDIK